MIDMEPLLSPDWYRVASMRPRLRAGVRVSSQQIRGETWYVLTDPMSGRNHLFNSVAYRLMSACNGERSLDEVWETLAASAGKDTPTQGKTVRVISQAFSANLLIGNTAPSAPSIVKTQARKKRQGTLSAINPISFKVPLWDPDTFLNTHSHRCRWLFTATAAQVCMALIGLGAILLLVNLTDYVTFAEKSLHNSQTLLILWFVYPLIKGLHEMAHALAVKAFGGEVHEIGITLLMLTPVPYVDASASMGFANKYQRVSVAAAGIVTELTLASLALGLWLLSEPGLLKDIAFAVGLIGGVSTLAVNGNPLLRFDGYHMLCDFFELPNLAQRSQSLWNHLFKRGLLGVKGPAFEGHARGAWPWLLAYAPLSWVCRAVLLVSMSVWLAGYSSLLGLAGLALAFWLCLLKPTLGTLRYVTSSSELYGQRVRAMTVAVVGTIALVALLFGAKLPHQTHVPGIIWLRDDAVVRLATEGFVEEFLALDGDKVVVGQPLLRLSNDELQASLQGVESQLRRREVERASNFVADAMQTGIADDETAALLAERQRLQQRVDHLIVRAGVAGRFVIAPSFNVVGRYLPQGELVAHVLSPGQPLVRVVVSNEDVAQVRDDVRSISVALAHAPGLQAMGKLVAGPPLVSKNLPSSALGDAAGGSIAQDPTDKSGRTALEPLFHFDLRLDAAVDARIGARALITIHHANISAADTIAYFVRRSFLRHFER